MKKKKDAIFISCSLVSSFNRRSPAFISFAFKMSMKKAFVSFYSSQPFVNNLIIKSPLSSLFIYKCMISIKNALKQVFYRFQVGFFRKVGDVRDMLM